MLIVCQRCADEEAELRAAGAARVFVDDGESSRLTDRPQWLACLDKWKSIDRAAMIATQRVPSPPEDGELEERLKAMSLLVEVDAVSPSANRQTKRRTAETDGIAIALQSVRQIASSARKLDVKNPRSAIT